MLSVSGPEALGICSECGPVLPLFVGRSDDYCGPLHLPDDTHQNYPSPGGTRPISRDPWGKPGKPIWYVKFDSLRLWNPTCASRMIRSLEVRHPFLRSYGAPGVRCWATLDADV